MKSKYVQPINLKLETGDIDLLVVPQPYDIEPLNMGKRVRVFINQLLPDILNEARTESGIEFALKVIGRHVYRFIPKLVYADMPDESLMVLIAVSETTTKLLKKRQGLRE